MRNETCSLAPGIEGCFGAGSAGFVVAALNAASALSLELVGMRGLIAIGILTINMNRPLSCWYPAYVLLRGPAGQDAANATAWISDIAGIARDEVYVDVHA